MPEARKFERVVTVAKSYNEFIDQIESFLSLDTKRRQALRDEAVALSKDHSWENRFLRAEQVLAEALSCE